MIPLPQGGHTKVNSTGYTMIDDTMMDIQLNVMNLSSYQISTTETHILSKGLHFCPNHDLNKFEIYKDLQLFIRKLPLKSLFNRQHFDSSFTPQERQALAQLDSLLQENETDTLANSSDPVSAEINANISLTPSNVASSKLKKNQIFVQHPAPIPMQPLFLNLSIKTLCN